MSFASIFSNAVLSAISIVIGLLGLLPLGLSFLGYIRMRRGQSPKSLWVWAIILASVLILIEIGGWIVLGIYLSRKARATPPTNSVLIGAGPLVSRFSCSI